MEIKGYIISSVALVISLGIAGIATFLWEKKRHKAVKRKKGKIALTFLFFTLIFFVGGFVLYFGTYYHATKEALPYLENGKYVTVTKDVDGYFFDGPGTEVAYIFYPGAKVDEAGYARLMYGIAEQGVDCFLVKMPLHMAFMGRDKATNIMRHYAYNKWYIGGHSLGGAMAAMYASEYGEKLDGLVLMAGFSTNPLPDHLRLLSIVGTKDKVLNWKNYEANKKNWPALGEEIRIEGGNHEQFGDYGHQKGDGKAAISAEEQQQQTIDAAVRIMLP